MILIELNHCMAEKIYKNPTPVKYTKKPQLHLRSMHTDEANEEFFSLKLLFLLTLLKQSLCFDRRRTTFYFC